MAGRGQKYQRRMQRFIDEVTVYPVSCERLAAGRSDEQWLDEVLRGGAKIVQLRDKDSSDRRLLEKAKYFRRKTLEADALFLVNDRLDIALLADADGIHLGQNDLPPDEVLKLAPEMIIGISCNTEEQARSLGAQEKKGNPAVSYYNIGPLYPTKTKEKLSEFIGPEAVARFSSCTTLPFTVMGGIKRHHIHELVALGARRIALVTALTNASDIAGETALWIMEIKQAWKRNQ
ncbi:MAG: thiamine phosphate synthase [Desulfobulbaceae bacterium]|nr:thiamine phosphate synthase [Desulfobulbaceae bacterium]